MYIFEALEYVIRTIGLQIFDPPLTEIERLSFLTYHVACIYKVGHTKLLSNFEFQTGECLPLRLKLRKDYEKVLKFGLIRL